MSFTVRYRPHFKKKLRDWNLPAEVLIDMRLAFDRLEENPTGLWERITDPFVGMAYTFPVVDRSNRVYGYAFTFHMRYGTDEQTLWVVTGDYVRVSL